MVDLIPSPESVMEILKKTGAYRRGHFVYPNGKHASHYFQMPLAFRYYDNARILSEWNAQSQADCLRFR